MDVIEPLPYYASLAKVLHGPTLALVLTYLEFHHQPSQDPSTAHPGYFDSPIVIECDTVCAALGISRRTLHIAFSCLGTCWSTEDARTRAARAGREFLNPAHSDKRNGYGQVKSYSFTGSKAYETVRSIKLRRNTSRLDSVLKDAGIIPFIEKIEVGGSSSAVYTLPEILKSVLPDWGDRRAERWDRWRRETGRKSSNPGRMRENKISVGPLD